MKKDGEWIACMSANLEVSRVDVTASPMLDLVEVRVTPRRGGPPRIEFYDRVELAALLRQLQRALDALEGAAVEAQLPGICRCGHNHIIQGIPRVGCPNPACSCRRFEAVLIRPESAVRS